MPNQYGAKAIYEKCLGKDCSSIVRRMPHDITKGSRKYCSKKCSDGKTKPVKYTQDTFDLIMEFHPTHSPADFAAHLGSTTGAIRKLMSIMRLAGYPLPKEKGGKQKWQVGDKKIRKDRGKEYEQVLTSSGWRSIPSEKKVEARKQQKKVTKRTAATITSAIRRPMVIVEVKPKEPAPKKDIPVYINSKTTVFVSTVEEIPAARMKYQHLNNSIYVR